MLKLSRHFDPGKHADARNDKFTRAWLRTQEETTATAQLKWWRHGIKADQVYRTLYDEDLKEVVGMVGLTSITRHNAEFSCLIYPKYRRRGYGFLGLSLLFDYGFRSRHLKEIYGNTYGYTHTDDHLLNFESTQLEIPGATVTYPLTPTEIPGLGLVYVNPAYELFKKIGMQIYGPCLFPVHPDSKPGRLVWRLTLQRHDYEALAY